MRIYRQDGTPVSKDHFMERKEAFNKEFDRIKDEVGHPNPTNSEVMEVYETRLKALDAEFVNKYPIFEDIEFPVSKENFKDLVEKYGGPICFCVEEEDVVGYIMPVASERV